MNNLRVIRKASDAAYALVEELGKWPKEHNDLYADRVSLNGDNSAMFWYLNSYAGCDVFLYRCSEWDSATKSYLAMVIEDRLINVSLSKCDTSFRVNLFDNDGQNKTFKEALLNFAERRLFSEER